MPELISGILADYPEYIPTSTLCFVKITDWGNWFDTVSYDPSQADHSHA